MDGKKPNWFQADGAGPSGLGLGDAGPSGAGPSGAGPSGAGPSGAGPSGAGPSGAGPSGAGPSGAGPSGAGPSGAGPSGAGPSGAGPSGAGPSGAGRDGDRRGGAGRGGIQNRSFLFLDLPGDNDNIHNHGHVFDRFENRFANGLDLFDWIDGQASPEESIRFNLWEDNADSQSGSSDDEYQRNVHEEANQRNQNMPADGRPNFHFAPPCMGCARCFFPAGCNYAAGFAAGFMSAQMQGQRGYQFRPNGNNVLHYMGFPINYFTTPFRVNPTMNPLRSASVARAWGLATGVSWMFPGAGVECGAGSGSTASGAGSGPTASGANGRKIPVTANHNNNAGLKRYVHITAIAYKYSNGQLLNDLFCIRDVHIHNISDVTDYVGMIVRMSKNPHLAEAMINHIECLKALLHRNTHTALSKQICLINAVMRLLHKPYIERESWTFEIMQTIAFDLRIICAKLAAPSCSGEANLQFDWIRNIVICTIHPSDCQCKITKMLNRQNADPGRDLF